MGAMKLYSIAETAGILGVSTRSVYRFMRQETNPLRASKIGGVWRVEKNDLHKFIYNGRTPQHGNNNL